MVKNCSFINNTTSANGGVIYNQGLNGEASPSYINCKFLANSANFGGAVFNHGVQGVSSPYVSNCIFSGNNANSNGGAMYNAGGGGGNASPELINCTFSGNSGGTLLNAGLNNGTSTPQLINCIIWNNEQSGQIGTAASSIENTSATPMISYSLIQGYNPTGIGNLDGTDSSNDPLFVQMPDPTTTPSTDGDLHLMVGSPVIDAGTNIGAPSTDLDGNPRDAMVDMGAYEVEVPAPCSSPVYFVNQQVVGGNNDGSSWANAFSDLQDALAALPTCPNVNKIWVAKGTYYPTTGTDQTLSFNIPSDIEIYGGLEGTEDPATFDLATRDFVAHETVLSGDIGTPNDDSDNTYNVIYTEGVSTSTIVDGFTITKGHANGQDTGIGRMNRGGGWFNNGSGNGVVSNPTIKNCSFIENIAAQDGGGLFNYGQDGTVSPQLENCLFKHNSAKYGGGLYHWTHNGTSSAILVACTFEDNIASEEGGGILAYNNTASILASQYMNCIFRNNTASKGGGISIFGDSDSNTNIFYNCLFFNNQATETGGVLAYNDSDNGSPEFINCTFFNNTASTGGVIGITAWNSGQIPVVLKNCIAWDNSSTFNEIGGLDIEYSLIQETSCPTGSNCDVNTLFGQNPLFVDAANGNFQLQDCSPAIEAGNNNYNTTTKDLLDNPRIHDADNTGAPIIDMGSYESQINTYIPGPYISSHPESQTIVEGQTITLSVVATAEGNLSYQWQKDGVDLLGETNSTLTINSATKGDNGNYSVVVSDNICYQSSQNATVLVCPIGNQIYVDENAVGTQSGYSWENAFTNLQDALNGIPCSQVNQIWVAKGTYYPTTGTNRNISFNIPEGIEIYGGFEGTEDPTTFDLSTRDFVNNETILSGDIGGVDNNSDNSYNVVRVTNTSDATILDGLTITGGNADGGSERGGGVYNSSSKAQFLNCHFSNCNAIIGGAVYNEGSNGNASPQFTNCIFVNNIADFGGAIFNYAVQGTTRPNLLNCTFENNRARQGGALYDSAPFIASVGSIVTNCIFKANSATEHGGAIRISGGSTNSSCLSLYANCLFIDNQADDVGGVLAYRPGTKQNPNFFACTFYNNTAMTGGVVGVTNWITGRKAPVLSNCIAWNNSSTFEGPGFTTFNYSLIQEAACPTGAECNDGLLFNQDPLFVNAAAGDFQLANCSPAIEAGKNSFNNETEDLLNNPRIHDADADGTAVIDMGAYEAQANTPKPIINNQPQSQNAAVGQDVIISVVVAGTGTLTYQWQKDGIDLSGEINSTLTINNATIGDTGDYTVVITSNNCFTESQAATLTVCPVRMKRLFVNHAATGNQTGLSWQDAFTNLQDALLEGVCSDVQEIWVAKGTYYPTSDNDRTISFVIPQGVSIYGGLTGTEDPNTFDLNTRDFNTNPTILSGDIGTPNDDADNSYTIVYTENISQATLVDGFTITKGHANGDTGINKQISGAGWFNTHNDGTNSTQLSIRNCIFENNSATNGGALFNYQTDIQMTNCQFNDNQATFGAAITFFTGSTTSSPQLSNCNFNDNTASSDGGAIYNYTTSSLLRPVLTNCDFLRNSATIRGGGIFSNSSAPQVTDCLFRSNTANTSGGAVFNYNDEAQHIRPSFINCIFQSNSADFGGAMFNRAKSTFNVQVISSLFKGNQSSSSGAAIYNFTNGGVLQSQFTNCLFGGNRAMSNGSVIHNSGSNATYLAITNCTFGGNRAVNQGGAITSAANISSIKINNTIMWNNQDASGQGASSNILLDSGNTIEINYSLIQGSNPSGIANINGTTSANRPLFVAAVSSSSAPTTAGDYRLQANSPAIDKGNNDADIDAGFGSQTMADIPTDMDGNTRLQDGDSDGTPTIDLGAFEFAAPLAVDWLNFQVTKMDKTAQLTWTIQEDAATSEYHIQHRTVQGTWQNIGTQLAKSKNGIYTYTFTHEHPTLGENYYRIEAIEYSGKNSFSIVKHLVFDDLQAEFMVYPNPTTNLLYIKAALNHSTKLDIQLFDVMGRLVKSEKIQITDTKFSASLDLTDLTNGVYTLRIDDGKMVRTQRVIKQ